MSPIIGVYPMKSRQRHAKKTPLPDYGSKRVQIRLMAVVASLLLVLSLMNEARKPETWDWMWKGGRGSSQSEEAAEQQEIDTRFVRPPSPLSPQGLVYVEPADTVSSAQSSPDAAGKAPAVGEAGQVSPAQHPSSPGSVPQTTTKDDRPSRDSSAPSEGSPQSNASPPNPPPVPDQPNPATGSQPESGSLRDSAAQPPLLLPATELAQIEDDTVWRPAERAPWFKLFGALQRMTSEQLRASATATAGFVQLFRQPDAYRGRLVTIQGQARLVYHVQAPKNELGIRGYYVFWIRPKGGPNSPLVVYSLELPAGFPAVPDKDRDRRTLEIDEPVTFTGFFFKRWAYRARGGLHTAPMLLARVPTWTPAPPRTDVVELPSPMSMASVLALLIVVALLVTRWVYRSSQLRFSRAERDLQATTPEALASLQQLRVLPRPEEHLRQLTQSANNQESP